MKKPFLGLAMTAALAVIALAATTSVNRVVSSVIDLSTETVDFAGVVHVVTKVPGGNSCAPTDPCRVFVNLANVNGVGRRSGGVYQFVGAANAKLTSAQVGVATKVKLGGFRAVPPNPIIPSDAISVQVTLTLDGQGGAAVGDVELGAVSCGVDVCP